jgi:hypothetical protein
MNDAVWECRLNFENYWGVSLLSSLRAIHRFLSSGEITGRKIKDTDGIPNEHGDWFISKRQKEFRDEDE